MPVVNSLEDRLAAVRLRFIARVPDEIAEFEAGLAALMTQVDTARPMLADQAHKLAGGAGMLGFQEIGGMASAVDRAIRRDGASVVEIRERVEQLLMALRAL